jgi:hypothetical protein
VLEIPQHLQRETLGDYTLHTCSVTADVYLTTRKFERLRQNANIALVNSRISGMGRVACSSCRIDISVESEHRKITR